MEAKNMSKLLNALLYPFQVGDSSKSVTVMML